MSQSVARQVLVMLSTIVGNSFLVLGSGFFGSLAILVGWIPPRGNWVGPVARGWARGLLWTSGVRLRVRYEGHVDSHRRYVFMANHQSLVDIAVLIASIPVQFRFLAKRSLFRIPVFGWALTAAGFVPVDRKRRDRAGETFSSALSALRQGASLMVFPEETRSLDGRLIEFRRGGFLMALKAGLAIVPVGIQGTLDVRPKGSFRICPGTVEVAFGRPIEVTEYGLKRKSELIADVAQEVGRLAHIAVR